MKDTIKGGCFTNLDDYDTSEVKEFARVPNIGERIFCKYKGNSTSLKVVQITHDFRNNEPFVIIELHNR